ncbi:phosphoesterase [Marmoricola endophyticus]|uniref:Phosphoesterase n=1 Tax=Marmoricola endophyticus TaxID=2040280 RepID=A0A917BFI4_9ACTN|nr:2'-5' RNA ligase family protein [Marmoricola endophyticus]GGF40835.1 phosphoesterase [Marmoricola endophyticus]
MTLIGVSVPVPDPAGRALQDFRVSLGEDEATGIPTHVTLVPPLTVPGHGDDLEEVCDHLDAAAGRHRGFDVRLRGTGTFRPVTPVVFVNLVAGISECELLAADVRRGPLATDLEFPYHPHVTVAHQEDEAALRRAFDELADFEAAFAVGSFWLYTYDENGWTPRQEFLLGGS